MPTNPLHQLPEPLFHDARLSKRLAVELTISAYSGIKCVWDPELPKRLTAREFSRYCAAMDRIYQQAADQLNMSLALVRKPRTMIVYAPGVPPERHPIKP
jgi:hypothetical protein